MDPDQITQIFCPHCRKGVAVRGQVPNESECPHCKKTFPTAEYAALSPTLRRTFVSSAPPPRLSRKSRSGWTPKGHSDAKSLDESVYRAARSINSRVPRPLFWLMAAFAGIGAPLLDGTTSNMGPLSTYSTLLFLFLFWLSLFGAESARNTLGSFVAKQQGSWRNRKGFNLGQKVELSAFACLSLGCLLLASANLLGLSELSLRTVFDGKLLTNLNWELREIGVFSLITGGLLWLGANKLLSSPK